MAAPRSIRKTTVRPPEEEEDRLLEQQARQADEAAGVVNENTATTTADDPAPASTAPTGAAPGTEAAVPKFDDLEFVGDFDTDMMVTQEMARRYQEAIRAGIDPTHPDMPQPGSDLLKKAAEFRANNWDKVETVLPPMVNYGPFHGALNAASFVEMRAFLGTNNPLSPGMRRFMTEFVVDPDGMNLAIGKLVNLTGEEYRLVHSAAELALDPNRPANTTPPTKQPLGPRTAGVPGPTPLANAGTMNRPAAPAPAPAAGDGDLAAKVTAARLDARQKVETHYGQAKLNLANPVSDTHRSLNDMIVQVTNGCYDFQKAKLHEHAAAAAEAVTVENHQNAMKKAKPVPGVVPKEEAKAEAEVKDPKKDPNAPDNKPIDPRLQQQMRDPTAAEVLSHLVRSAVGGTILGGVNAIRGSANAVSGGVRSVKSALNRGKEAKTLTGLRDRQVAALRQVQVQGQTALNCAETVASMEKVLEEDIVNFNNVFKNNPAAKAWSQKVEAAAAAKGVPVKEMQTQIKAATSNSPQELLDLRKEQEKLFDANSPVGQAWNKIDTCMNNLTKAENALSDQMKTLGLNGADLSPYEKAMQEAAERRKNLPDTLADHPDKKGFQERLKELAEKLSQRFASIMESIKNVFSPSEDKRLTF